MNLTWISLMLNNRKNHLKRVYALKNLNLCWKNLLKKMIISKTNVKKTKLSLSKRSNLCKFNLNKRRTKEKNRSETMIEWSRPSKQVKENLLLVKMKLWSKLRQSRKNSRMIIEIFKRAVNSKWTKGIKRLLSLLRTTKNLSLSSS